MAALSSSASTDTTQEQQEPRVVVPQSREERVDHDNRTTENTQASHENTTLLQPHSEATDPSQDIASVIQNESTPPQNREAVHARTPPSNTRRDSQEATVPSHGNTPELQSGADTIDDSENGVQSGQHYPMTLDVSLEAARYLSLNRLMRDRSIHKIAIRLSVWTYSEF